MNYIHDDFMLRGEAARRLYHEHVKGLPIIDYHGHLSPEQIADDTRFENLTRIWLDGDHYKWRIMRACGVRERLITGGVGDRKRFEAWAETMPRLLRNPLYHWSHMELATIFGIRDRQLDARSAEHVWGACNELLSGDGFSARDLIRRHGVRVVATTDDPADSLEHHERFTAEGEAPGFRMVPTLRPDRGMDLSDHDAFSDWITRLQLQTGMEIDRFETLVLALENRYDAFAELGCRASDHAVEVPHAVPFTGAQVEEAFARALAGKPVTEEQVRIYQSAFLQHCGRMAHERDWVFQLHIGALRNNNTPMFHKLGRDAGFDSMGDRRVGRSLARLLDTLRREERLPRMVVYNLNPSIQELVATMLGNFQSDSTPSRLQHGPSWWFLDYKEGIEKHIETLSAMCVLSEFIGMTTDSRSFLSWPRHDYFRRILCNVLGKDLEDGLVPNDERMVADLLVKVCHRNAEAFFNYPGPPAAEEDVAGSAAGAAVAGA